MSSKIWVRIDATGKGVNGLLANEALRKAAEEHGFAYASEVIGEGSANVFRDTPAAGDFLLLVNKADIPNDAFAHLAQLSVELNDVLSNANAVITRLIKQAPVVTGNNPTPPAKRIVAVTACPTGIAHTFMAAEGLVQAAAALGIEMRVETQGSVGVGTPLTAEEIAQADIVIIAAEREVERNRFTGKRVYISTTKPAITDGQNLIRKAFEEAQLQQATEQSDSAASPTTEKRAGPYKHLMTGVSFMLPFVVAGGLLIAIAFAIGGIKPAEGSLGATLLFIGGKGGFALMVPALAGYIAYSISDRPGLAPGMIGGLICNSLGAGFLGGILAGFIAGYGVYYLNKSIPLPKNLAGLKPVLILPFLGTLLTGLSLYYVVGGPVAEINTFLTGWLRGLQGTQSIVLGLIIGGMMALDLGGPVNKAAYAFSVGMLESQVYMPMAAAMAAGMTPPLAAALATRLFKSRFTAEEREAGSAAFVLGLAFISEGAIPFAARDPFRVIPAFVIGSATAGAISMGLGINLLAPHGGIFVLPIPNAVSNVAAYAGAIAAGTVVSALIMGILKKKRITAV